MATANITQVFTIRVAILTLAMPFSVNPAWVVLPFAVLFALILRIAGMTFKKYL